MLESIPEWTEYVEGCLKKHNEIEAKPLGQDPKGSQKKGESDDFLDLMFKLKLGNNKSSNNEASNDDDDDEEEESDNVFGTTQTNPVKRGFTNEGNDDDDDEDDS